MSDLMEMMRVALAAGAEINITIRMSPTEVEVDKTTVTCTDCGWTRTYSRPDNATQGLKRHFRNCTPRKNRLNGTIPQGLRDLVSGNLSQKH